jgi:hypothetical protein
MSGGAFPRNFSCSPIIPWGFVHHGQHLFFQKDCSGPHRPTLKLFQKLGHVKSGHVFSRIEHPSFNEEPEHPFFNQGSSQLFENPSGWQ